MLACDQKAGDGLPFGVSELWCERIRRFAPDGSTRLFTDSNALCGLRRSKMTVRHDHLSARWALFFYEEGLHDATTAKHVAALGDGRLFRW